MKARQVPRVFSALPLRWIIFLSFAGILSIVAIATSGISFLTVAKLAQDVLLEDVQDSANDVALLIEKSLLERRREIELLAASQELREPDRNPATVRVLLRRAQEGLPRYALIGFVNAAGQMQITSNGLAEGADVSDRQYWTEGRAGVYVGDAHDAILLARSLGAADKVPRLIDLAAPVREGNGITGVVVAHLSTEWAEDVGQDIVNRLFARYRQVSVTVLGGDGTPMFTRRNFADADIEAERLLTRSAIVNGIGPNGTLSWPVNIKVPVHGSANESSADWHLVGGLIVIFGTALILAWLFARAIAAPIERLSAALILDQTLDPANETAWTSGEVQDITAAVRLGVHHGTSV